jgi:hypothetical protein
LSPTRQIGTHEFLEVINKDSKESGAERAALLDADGVGEGVRIGAISSNTACRMLVVGLNGLDQEWRKAQGT